MRRYIAQLSALLALPLCTQDSACATSLYRVQHVRAIFPRGTPDPWDTFCSIYDALVDLSVVCTYCNI